MSDTTLTDPAHTHLRADDHAGLADLDSWSDLPVDEAYDTPIPFTAPAWLQLSRAQEYDDYDAAIPFHVVEEYTQHMSDDGDSLDR